MNNSALARFFKFREFQTTGRTECLEGLIILAAIFIIFLVAQILVAPHG